MRSGRCARVAVLVVVGVGAVAVRATSAAAQGQGGGSARIRVQLSQSVVSFPAPGLTEFDAGYVDAPALFATVRPRPNQAGAWELRVQAEAPDMGGYGKPVSDILWRRDGSTTWRELTPTAQTVIQGTGPRDVTVFFRLRLDYARDAPDGYSADLSFSARTL